MASPNKGTVFFFPGISSFLCVFWEILMNEWKSYFFSGAGKKNSSEIEWMNGMWTFPGKKKTQKKTHTPGEKKNRNLPKNRSPNSAFCFILVRFRQVAPTQPNTTNLKTVWVVAQLGAGVTIFERHYRVVLTARDSNRWHQPGEFYRTVELEFWGNWFKISVLVIFFVWNYSYFIVNL